MNLNRIAGWMFRIYLVVLLAGVIVLGVGWATAGLADTPWIGTLWYGISVLGTVTLGVLVAARLRGNDHPPS